jgi:hypothetical protein
LGIITVDLLFLAGSLSTFSTYETVEKPFIRVSQICHKSALYTSLPTGFCRLNFQKIFSTFAKAKKLGVKITNIIQVCINLTKVK